MTTVSFEITTPDRKRPFVVTVPMPQGGAAFAYSQAACAAAQRIYRLKRIGASRTTGIHGESGYFIGNVANRYPSNVDHASYGEPFHVRLIES